MLPYVREKAVLKGRVRDPRSTIPVTQNSSDTSGSLVDLIGSQQNSRGKLSCSQNTGDKWRQRMLGLGNVSYPEIISHYEAIQI